MTSGGLGGGDAGAVGLGEGMTRGGSKGGRDEWLSGQLVLVVVGSLEVGWSWWRWQGRSGVGWSGRWGRDGWFSGWWECRGRLVLVRT